MLLLSPRFPFFIVLKTNNNDKTFWLQSVVCVSTYSAIITGKIISTFLIKWSHKSPLVEKKQVTDTDEFRNLTVCTGTWCDFVLLTYVTVSNTNTAVNVTLVHVRFFMQWHKDRCDPTGVNRPTLLVLSLHQQAAEWAECCMKLLLFETILTPAGSKSRWNTSDLPGWKSTLSFPAVCSFVTKPQETLFVYRHLETLVHNVFLIVPMSRQRWILTLQCFLHMF